MYQLAMPQPTSAPETDTPPAPAGKGAGLVLVLGGARSGKSTYAESRIAALQRPCSYIATAEAMDDEMRARIETHRARRSAIWRTIEAPHSLAAALSEIAEGEPVLVDCLTLWLTNRLLAGADLATERAALTKALAARRGLTIVVANEVGLGIVPDNALSRRFRDEAGFLHQQVATVADEVHLMVAGLSIRAK